MVHSNSAAPLGKGGWSAFKFLFFDQEGILQRAEKMASFMNRVHLQFRMSTDWQPLHSVALRVGVIFSSSFSCRGVYQDKFYNDSTPIKSIDVHT